MRQHEIIAVEKGAKARYEEAKSSAYQLLQKAELLDGMARRYEPKDEDGEQLPPERKLVQVRAAEVLQLVANAEASLFDVVATKDFGNTIAKADVVVDGHTLIKEVPVTYLLWLEKQLEDLHTLISKLPTLDPSEQWSFDDNQNCFTTEPTKKARVVRIKEAIVLYDATPEHPAQTQLIEKDVLAGYWTAVRYSGALTVARVRQLRERVRKLQDAVKIAREKANATQIENITVGQPVMDWLLSL